MPEGASVGTTRIAEIRAGQTLQIDDVVRSFFQSADGGRGGSVIVTMPSAAPIVATARTYHQTTDGSFGLFIPGVTVAEGAGVGDRAMQVLQLKESERFRTTSVSWS